MKLYFSDGCGGVDWLITSLIWVSVLFVVLSIRTVIYETKETNKFTEKCEQAGGVYLKNSRKVGKLTSTSFVCVRKETVIDLEIPK